jgi:hypothetical protein
VTPSLKEVSIRISPAMRKIHVAAICLCLGVLTIGAQTPVPPFFSGVTVGDNVGDVKIADALRRIDGRWLTFGSRRTSDPGGRETAVLVLRDTDGATLDVRELSIDGDLSYRPMSMVAAGGDGDVVVLGVEYDTDGNRSISLTRVNAALAIVWSTRIASSAGVFDWPRLAARDTSEEIVLMGEFRRFVAGGLDNGDAFVAKVQPDGTVSGIRTLGTASDYERTVDAQPVGSDGSMLLLIELARFRASGTESGDALVLLDPTGSIVTLQSIGHSMPPGVRARALRLLPHAGGGWVVAGRRTAFGPNVFYVHKIADDLTPDAARTLIPFFNVMDVDARDGAVWLYGEANGEVMDTGTVLIGLDGGLQMFLQRRYGTENTVFPTGAFEFSPGGALLALGARRSSDQVFAYDAVHHVALPSGAGVLCDEGDYRGFSTVLDATTVIAGWQPAANAVDPTITAVAASTPPLPAANVELCVRASSRVPSRGTGQPPGRQLAADRTERDRGGTPTVSIVPY